MTVTHFMQNEKFPTSKLVARKLVAGILYRFFFIQKKKRAKISLVSLPSRSRPVFKYASR